MSSQIECTFKIEKWDETQFSKSKDGPQLNRASVAQSYSGDLEATSTIEYLMATFREDFSTFVGMEEVIGELEGKSGSFLLQHNGTYEDGTAKSTFQIIPHSGTGELEGISGKGHYQAT
ncbi:MAG: DUF3224 domain-containing protein, partial [Balneolaceae bacterium]|nr:DUF3224 domain-containing protein [Balneolaceae bacterium]